LFMTTQTMADSERAKLSTRLGTALLYGTFGLLMAGPLAFGAVEPWSIFVLEAGALILALLWLAKGFVDRELTIEWNPLFLPIAAFGVLILAQIAFRTSTYLHDTIAEALLYLAYGMLCFVSTQSLLRASQARRMAIILSFYGFAIAALALVQGIAPNGKLYWLREPQLGGWIYGPYVNHNHYAGLMEMLIPIPLVISLSHLAHEKERMAGGIAAAVMTGTVFLSGSRGGMLALLTEFLLLGIFVARQKRGVRTAVGVGVFAIVVVGLLTWLGGRELTTRMFSIGRETRTEISGGMRLSIDRDALSMFRRKPVLGWGLGAFPVAYPQFRSFYTNFFVNEAHNDYLQLLTETGVVGFAVMMWFVVALYRTAIRKISHWTSSVSGSLTLACLLGITGILVHSCFDFNLQIPANAALFYVLCSLAASPPLLQRSRKRLPVIPSSSDDLLPASEVV
jgi:O-antigen ligase